MNDVFRNRVKSRKYIYSLCHRPIQISKETGMNNKRLSIPYCLFLLTRQEFIKRRQIYMSYYIYIYNLSILLAYVYLYVILLFYRDRRRHTISTLLLGYTHIDIYFCILLPKYYIMLYPSVYIQPNTKFVLSYKWNQICHGPGVSLSNIVFTI